jgi:hypothetical protein
MCRRNVIAAQNASKKMRISAALHGLNYLRNEGDSNNVDDGIASIYHNDVGIVVHRLSSLSGILLVY